MRSGQGQGRKVHKKPRQLFNIRWNSHHKTVSNVFLRLLEEERFVDVSLACEGQIIKCHRLILSACSKYFDSILSANQDKMVIYMAGMKFWELKELVMFMYKGEVSVLREQAEAFIQAGQDLQIEGLLGINPLYINGQSNLQFGNQLSPSKYQIGSMETIPESSGESHPAGSSNDQAKCIMPLMPVPLNKIKTEVDDEGFAEVGAVGGSQVINPAYIANNVAQAIDLSHIKTEKMDMDPNFEDKELVSEPGGPFEQHSDPTGNETEKESTVRSQSTEPAGEQSELEDEGEDKCSREDANDVSDFGNLSLEQAESSTPTGSNSRRMKYRLDIKEKAVSDLINGMALGDCAERYNVPKKTLSNWKSKHMKSLTGTSNFSDLKRLKKGKEIKKKVYDTPTEPKNKGKGRKQAYVFPTSSLPPVVGLTREEHLKNAAKLVVDKMTNVRGAANHYGIPRTTLSNYMRRNGLTWLRKAADPEPEPLSPDSSPDENTPDADKYEMDPADTGVNDSGDEEGEYQAENQAGLTEDNAGEKTGQEDYQKTLNAPWTSMQNLIL